MVEAIPRGALSVVGTVMRDAAGVEVRELRVVLGDNRLNADGVLGTWPRMLGTDFTFEDVSTAWGFATENDVAHGAASADLDLDGDLDIVVNRQSGPAAVYRNDAIAPRVAVRLHGLSPNTQGIAA